MEPDNFFEVEVNYLDHEVSGEGGRLTISTHLRNGISGLSATAVSAAEPSEKGSHVNGPGISEEGGRSSAEL